jgi:hypothetical protein
MAEAELARFIDRYTAEYVRTYAHQIDCVWHAITDPAKFDDWFIRIEMPKLQADRLRNSRPAVKARLAYHQLRVFASRKHGGSRRTGPSS